MAADVQCGSNAPPAIGVFLGPINPAINSAVLTYLPQKYQDQIGR